MRLILDAAMLALTTTAALAQMGPDNTAALDGLPSIRLAIEGIDEEAKKCGITEGLIRDAFLYPISQSRIMVSTNKSGPVFLVNIDALIQDRPNQCISSVKAAVVNFQLVELDYAPDAPFPPVPPVRFAAVTLWDTGAIIVGGRHAERISAKIEEFTKKFITTWNLANRP